VPTVPSLRMYATRVVEVASVRGELVEDVDPVLLDSPAVLLLVVLVRLPAVELVMGAREKRREEHARRLSSTPSTTRRAPADR